MTTSICAENFWSIFIITIICLLREIHSLLKYAFSLAYFYLRKVVLLGIYVDSLI